MPLGSGEVEGGNKLYKNRMAGPRSWKIEHAENMLNILTLDFNNELSNYWMKKEKDLKIYEDLKALKGGK